MYEGTRETGAFGALSANGSSSDSKQMMPFRGDRSGVNSSWIVLNSCERVSFCSLGARMSSDQILVHFLLLLDDFDETISLISPRDDL
ncbi:uncharacterized protein MONOS_13876 [Monocercomonoides exilis]|uniref:uncharacterized protein n=1 Tax=Monocercomonoides exilis TaxID=2049356 RepID=UPI00355A20FE|nr:hypothetical protein MONOS_13876 [Monocercomonoides exilis]|eukprot:MONOS_13876.1-p1 / transcript=MONOS_13876.1 / gene=MONOS_13876 / organism=Monocercomonoides_exilis_PA203 / gene_product=unspecified product / transcript_product=unspecified product / location=Mono_scaffold00897:13117-13380(-) / protein_length=88 / sequence_SO=supercontig / SO=protein_coding / is_pseudo=false